MATHKSKPVRKNKAIKTKTFRTKKLKNGKTKAVRVKY